MRITRFSCIVLRVLFFALATSCSAQDNHKKIITKIVVQGNSLVRDEAVLQRLLYKTGDVFDPDLSAAAINKLYSLGYFSQIRLEKEEDDDSIILQVVLQEKKLLDAYEIDGNQKITTKKLIEKLGLKNYLAVDDHDVLHLCSQIRKLYREDNYHQAKVTGEVKPSENSKGIELLLKIEEGPASQVREVHFEGVHQIPEWRLRSALMTKELWLLGFADGSGRFNREMIEADKQNIEFVYQDLGFARAHVVDTKIEYPENDQSTIKLTFYIDEGAPYRVRYVMLPYDIEITKQEFLDAISIKEGSLYSRSQVLATLERIRAVLGKHGYSYADVYPIPRVHDDTKIVDFTFGIEKGEKVRVRRIDITGNKLTHDKVIRREVTLEEGAFVTLPEMNLSKRRVEALGFFDRGGVVWKTHKLSDGLVDLELAVNEVKTGNFQLVGGLGAREGRLGSGMHVGINVGKRNLFGRGWNGAFSLMSERSRLGLFSFNFYNPYIFDTNIEFALDTYYRVEEYDQWGASTRRPRERIKGGVASFGFRIPELDRDLKCNCELGIESNKFLNFDDLFATNGYSNFMLQRRLKAGVLMWLGASASKDTRNHPVYPTRGYRLAATSKLALPGMNGAFSFMKLETVGSWYTPLIGEDTLVLAVRAKTGLMQNLSSSSTIPYRELYHMGGQDTIRGFVGGGAGPVLVQAGELRERNNTPLGARRHILLNVELQTPMIESYGMRGRLFYDAGCGWDAMLDDVPSEALSYIKRNAFNVRHAVGFGFSMTRPQMVKIDWGYKLDRDKKFNESDWEVHLSMNVPW